MTDADSRLSPSRLATYGICPRQYQHDYVWEVETPEQSRRYLDRGLAYHAAIEETCDEVRGQVDSFSDTQIRQLALDHLASEWADRVTRSAYESDAQYQYDRDLTVSAIESFFEGDGLDHVRNSIATEETVTCDRGETSLRGRVDNIVRTDDGLHIYDYKGSFNGIISGYSAESIPLHREGEEYIADTLKSIFQAAIYIEGAKNLDVYESGMDVQFSFYALMTNKDSQGHPDGLRVSVSGYPREVTDIYQEYEDDIWALIEACYDGIHGEEFVPTRLEEIREHACDDCDYRGMCGDYLNEEVRIDE